jgi:hypothetical protein
MGKDEAGSLPAATPPVGTWLTLPATFPLLLAVPEATGNDVSPGMAGVRVIAAVVVLLSGHVNIITAGPVLALATNPTKALKEPLELIVVCNAGRVVELAFWRSENFTAPPASAAGQFPEIVTPLLIAAELGLELMVVPGGAWIFRTGELMVSPLLVQVATRVAAPLPKLEGIVTFPLNPPVELVLTVVPRLVLTLPRDKAKLAVLLAPAAPHSPETEIVCPTTGEVLLTVNVEANTAAETDSGRTPSTKAATLAARPRSLLFIYVMELMMRLDYYDIC